MTFSEQNDTVRPPRLPTQWGQSDTLSKAQTRCRPQSLDLTVSRTEKRAIDHVTYWLPQAGIKLHKTDLLDRPKVVWTSTDLNSRECD